MKLTKNQNLVTTMRIQKQNKNPLRSRLGLITEEREWRMENGERRKTFAWKRKIKPGNTNNNKKMKPEIFFVKFQEQLKLLLYKMYFHFVAIHSLHPAWQVCSIHYCLCHCLLGLELGLWLSSKEIYFRKRFNWFWTDYMHERNIMLILLLTLSQ